MLISKNGCWTKKTLFSSIAPLQFPQASPSVHRVNWLPLIFSFVVLFWVSGFDIIYALQDEDFDKGKKLSSIPVLLGKKNALMVSNVLHVLAGGFILFAGYYAQLNYIYWIGAAIFNILLIYQHTLVKPHDLSKVNLAFFTTNGVASVVFAILVLFSIFT